MADDKRVNLWISIKDGVSAGVVKMQSSWKKNMEAMQKSALLFAAGFAGTVAGIYKGITAYGIQEQAISDLNAALKTAGNYSDAASKDLQKYASELQKVTTYGDEAILSAQSIIASFGIEGQQLKDLTKATLDLAQAKGMDLKSAADLVSKSVGSSTNALSRYGITIEGAAGSTKRTQQAVDNIAQLFGGRAEAAALTFNGRMKQVSNQVGDVAETIGKPFADALANIIGKFAQAVSAIAPFIEKHANLIAVVLTAVAGVTGLIAAFAGFVAIAPAVGAAITVMTGPIGIITVAIAGLVGAVAYFATSNSQMAQNIRAIWNTIGTMFSSYANAIKETFGNLGKYLKGFGAILSGVFTGNISKIKKGLKDMKASVLDSGKAFGLATDEIVEAYDRQLEAQKELQDESLESEAEHLENKNQQKLEKAEEAFELEQELDEIRREYEEELAAERLAFEQATHEEKLRYLVDALGKEKVAKDAARIQEKIAAGKHNEAEKLATQLYADAFLATHKNKLEEAAKTAKDYHAKDLSDLLTSLQLQVLHTEFAENQKRMIAEQTRGFLANVRSLMASDDQRLFMIGKRFAQAQAIINAALAITKSYAQLGPILGTVAAIAIGFATREQVRTIENTNFQAAGGAYAPGDGATVRMGERGNPEWIMNQGNIRELVREASNGGNVSVRVFFAGSEIRPAIVEIEQTKQQMIAEGTL